VNPRIIFILILLFNISFTKAAYATPINFACAKNQIINYYNNLTPDSDYLKDVNTVIKQAERYLNKRVAENNRSRHPAKLAMVLDIDDTSVSNFPGIKEDDFSNSLSAIDTRYKAANAPAITPVLRLYNQAIAKSITVFFISVRRPLATTPNEDLRPYTIQNLQNAGYAGWTELYLPQGDDLALTSAEYKTKIRKLLTEAGYDIILNIGDQETDLIGGYADQTEKLPNYLYSTSANPCDSVKACHSNS
jgi:predicted secreted acid phosphatase